MPTKLRSSVLSPSPGQLKSPHATDDVALIGKDEHVGKKRAVHRTTAARHQADDMCRLQ